MREIRLKSFEWIGFPLYLFSATVVKEIPMTYMAESIKVTSPDVGDIVRHIFNIENQNIEFELDIEIQNLVLFRSPYRIN